MPPPGPSLSKEGVLQLRYHYVEFLTEHLSDCCRAFDGDLQEMLVLAILGQVHMRALLDAGPDGVVKPRQVPGPAGITASRLADVTGIPRQTVRRKLDKLCARGWVEKRTAGIFALTTRDGAVVARESDGIAALDARSMERVMLLARRMSAIVT